MKINRLGWTDLELINIGLGKAETLVHEAIRKISNPPIIATKCGLQWNSDRKLMNVLKKESVKKEDEFSSNLKLIDGLRPIAEEKGRTLAQLALSWVLRRSEVTAAIVGARRSSQLDDAIRLRPTVRRNFFLTGKVFTL